MNFSRYLPLRSAWLFPRARWNITVNKCSLQSPCYALLWELVIPKNNDFVRSIAYGQVKLHLFWATEKITVRIKLSNVGIPWQRDRSGHRPQPQLHFHQNHSLWFGYRILRLSENSVFWAHFRKRLFALCKSRTLTKSELCQTGW